jgi:DNA-binding response OmpR family regulator
MKKLLCIDDHDIFLDFLSKNLSPSFDIETLNDSRQLKDRITENHYDGFLVDLNMPYHNGETCFDCINKTVPKSSKNVFILTIEDDPLTRVSYLERGACDYLNKTMHPKELIIRIQNALNYRSHAFFLQKGNLTLNHSDLIVEINQKITPLTLIEFKILSFLLKNDNEMVPKDLISSYVWKGSKTSQGSFNTHLSNLKLKLKEWDHDIQNIRLQGLRITKK